MRSSSSKIRGYAWGIVLVLALPLSLLLVPGWRPADFLVRHWITELPSLSDEGVLPRLRQIADLGDEQWPSIVRTLASRRPAETAAARTVIREQLLRWKLLPPAQSSRKIHRLARELFTVFPDLEDRNREFAAELASRMVEWPVDQSVGDMAEILQCCERMLRAAPPVRSRTTIVWSGNMAGAAKSANASDDDSTATRERDEPLPEIPLTPIRNFELTSLSRPETIATAENVGPGTAGIEPASRDSVTGTTGDTTPNRTSPTTVRELIDQLRAVNLAESSQAIRQLRERGFGDREFDLALRLGDPDPRVRKALAETLPELLGVDPVPWLIWLSQDESTVVRRTASGIMATSSDPRLQARLRAMEIEDTDDEVVRIARQARS